MALKQPKIEIFEGKNSRWFWRLIARNTQTIARCAEDGYVSKSAAMKAAAAVTSTFKSLTE